MSEPLPPVYQANAPTSYPAHNTFSVILAHPCEHFLRIGFPGLRRLLGRCRRRTLATIYPCKTVTVVYARPGTKATTSRSVKHVLACCWRFKSFEAARSRDHAAAFLIEQQLRQRPTVFEDPPPLSYPGLDRHSDSRTASIIGWVKRRFRDQLMGSPNQT